jgi:hypothetical protein
MIPKKYISNLSNYWLAVLFVLFFFIDFASKALVNLSNIFIHTSVLFKAVFQLFIIFFALLNYNSKLKKFYILLLLLLLNFLASNLFSLSNTHYIERIINNIKVFSWYIFPFFLFVGWFYVRKQDNISSQLSNLFIAFEYVFLINCFFIFIGLIFDVSLFKAYSFGRFGFIGLLRNVSHSSYIFMIFVAYFLLKVQLRSTLYNYILVCLSFLVCFLLATKAILLFLLLISLYFSFKINFKAFLIFLTCFVLIVYFNIDNLLFLLKIHSPVLSNVLEKKGMLTMLFSYRNLLFTDCFIPYITENWTLLNFIFGGAEFNLYRTELELIDLFWFFGVFGSAIYLYLLNNYFLDIKNLIKIKPVMFIFFISLLAGSFLSSVPVMTFLFVLLLYIDNNKSKRALV